MIKLHVLLMLIQKSKNSLIYNIILTKIIKIIDDCCWHRFSIRSKKNLTKYILKYTFFKYGLQKNFFNLSINIDI